MIGTCPRCLKKFSYNNYDVDYVHDCNSNITTLDNESVPIMGTYTDESTGSVVTEAKQKVALQGIHNENIEMHEDLNAFGKSTQTNRIRKHSEYIQLR